MAQPQHTATSSSNPDLGTAQDVVDAAMAGRKGFNRAAFDWIVTVKPGERLIVQRS